MATESSNAEAETALASTKDPIETSTDESAISSSLNKDKSEEDSSDGNEHSNERDGEEDEDEEDNNESNGEEEEDDDVDSIVDDGDSTSDQPEWGVDSYDEKEFWSPDEDYYTDDEDERKTRLYYRNLHFSHGFLVEKGIRPRTLWSGSITLQSLDSTDSPVEGRTELEYAQDMVKLCLRKYNALNETDVKLDHVVRVTESFCGRWKSYITFMARESEDEEKALVEYQAKVVKKLRHKSYPIFCRPSPKMDPDM